MIKYDYIQYDYSDCLSFVIDGESELERIESERKKFAEHEADMKHDGYRLHSCVLLIKPTKKNNYWYTMQYQYEKKEEG